MRNSAPTTMVHIFITFFAFDAALAADDYFPKPNSEGGWRVPNDAAQIRKVAGMGLNKLDYAERTSRHGGLPVVRHGSTMARATTP